MTGRRRRADRQPRFLAYTAITIVVGILAFAWAVVTFPISPAISLTMTGGSEGVLLGLVFWVALGLLGGMRVEHLHGHGALTFHLPFIIAAMALGGPVAGGIVAMISTIERREFTDMPWYGLVSNHAHLTLAAVLGGVAMLVTREAMVAVVGADPAAVELVTIVAGSLAFALVAAALAAGTFMLRDGLTVAEAVRVYDTSFRLTAASEVVVGWLLVLTYASIGWWATGICATLVLMIWQGHDARELARHDPLTGLLSRAGFDSRLSETINTAKRRRHGFAVIAIDLDGFKAINDRFGHHIGDDVIREVGARIRAGIRLTDAGVRRGGDEYGVLLADVDSRQTAESVARRLLTSITKPIRTGGRDLRVGASFGVLIVEPDADIPRIVDIHRTTDALMYEAKAIPGGRRARVARASRGEGSMQVEVLAPEPEGADAPAGTDLVA